MILFPTAIPTSKALPQEFLVSLSICGSVPPGFGNAPEVAWKPPGCCWIFLIFPEVSKAQPRQVCTSREFPHSAKSCFSNSGSMIWGNKWEKSLPKHLKSPGARNPHEGKCQNITDPPKKNPNFCSVPCLVCREWLQIHSSNTRIPEGIPHGRWTGGFFWEFLRIPDLPEGFGHKEWREEREKRGEENSMHRALHSWIQLKLLLPRVN